ncbi:MAG: hypothetical protein PHS77_08820 [Gallionellaceae bacterium]|nr:hypothetical protein [Gallionellaceae bacterium]
MIEISIMESRALLTADKFMREAFENVRAFNAEQHPQFRGDVLRQVEGVVQSATMIYAADRIATALEAVAEAQGRLADAAENIGAETGFVAEALEKLAEVAGHAAGDLAMIADRGLGHAP